MRWSERAAAPVSSASLGAFRILWGLLLAYECATYLTSRAKLEDSSSQYFHFPFYGFEWIPQLSYACKMHDCYPDLTFADLRQLMWALLIAGLCIAAGTALQMTFTDSKGFLHRLFSLAYAIGFTYFWLIDLTNYLNHFYLITIFTFLCAFLPLNGSYAIDHLLFPSTKKATVPSWTYWLLRSEITIVYFYAAVAKVNIDWLYATVKTRNTDDPIHSRGEPLRHWLLSRSRSQLPVLGSIFKLELGCYLLSYGGLFFDFLAPALLLYGPTRPLGFCLSGMFHIMNKFIFNIGIFPAAMSTLTTIFLPDDWPSAIWQLVHRVPRPLKIIPQTVKKSQHARIGIVTIVLIVLFLGLNAVLPLRHYTYPGDVAWHEHGHRFSWRMKLRDKDCIGAFILQDPVTNYTSRGSLHLIEERQEAKMWARPEMVVQYAHYLAHQTVQWGAEHRPRVFAAVNCSLNFRPWQALIEPTHDLAAYDVWDWPYPFIRDLEPLPPNLQEQLLWRRPLREPHTFLARVDKRATTPKPPRVPPSLSSVPKNAKRKIKQELAEEMQMQFAQRMYDDEQDDAKMKKSQKE